MRVGNMHKGIKVSVLVPVYNVKRFLPKCFDALVNQTYKNLEIIFVDDASTDGSREYLENNIKRLKNAKLLLHDCNKNLFLTRITAMKECTGDYIICLDSDDYVDYDYYEALVKKMIDTDADMCIGDIELEYDNIQKNTKLNAKFEKNYYSNEECIDYLFFSRKNRFVSVWNKMISRRVLNKALLDLEKMQEGAEGINICEDNIFLFVFACYTNKLVCANGPKYHYVQHSNQSTVFDSKDKLIMQLNSLLKATDKIINFLKEKNLYKKYEDKILNRYNSIFRFLKSEVYKNGFSNDLEIKNAFNFDFKSRIFLKQFDKFNLFKFDRFQNLKRK